MKQVILFFLLLGTCLNVSGQNIDSLLEVASANPDTAVINRLYEAGNQIELSDHTAAKRIYRAAGELSEQIDYPVGRIRYASNYTFLLNMEGELDSSLTINLHALALAREIDDQEQIHKVMVNIGNVYHYKQLFNTAMEYYVEALPWFEKEGNKNNLASLYDIMQVLYQRTGHPEQGIAYGEKALELLNDDPDEVTRGYVLLNLAPLYSSCFPRKWDKHLASLQEALRIAETNNLSNLKASVLNNLGNYHIQHYDYQTAEAYAREALKLHSSVHNLSGYLISNRALAYCDLSKGDYAKAEARLREGLLKLKEQERPTEEGKYYEALADLVLLKEGDYMKSQQLMFVADSLKNLVVNEQIRRANEELKIKYETEKKEHQIAALHERERSALLIGLIGGIALLAGLLAMLFLWLWSKQKRRKAELQLQQAEQEKQLVATRSILEGEMQERSRLARDLHDGLGSILSAAKINMSELKSGAVMEYADVKSINRIMELLDESMRELRRVAHHLMPESLSRYGLKVALSDFCHAVKIIEFAWFGAEERLESQLEVVVYRIVHELVNNALKYAEASRILVNVVQDRERISITVEDNGIGFDIHAVTLGTGLHNIRERVAALEGNIDVSSGSEGTEVHVELKITKNDTGTDSGRPPVGG